MAAINSLAYLFYSILTLAGNHKPTIYLSLNVDPDHSAFAEQDPYIPPRVDPYHSAFAEQDPYIPPRVDPDHSIFAEQYPYIPPSENFCPKGEEYSPCHSHCEGNCVTGENKNCQRVGMLCVSGCTCKAGLVRGPDGTCIYDTECPTTPPPEPPTKICPENELYDKCNAACQRNCSNVDSDIPCLRICQPGCVCKESLIRGKYGKCIAKDECPQDESSLVDPYHTDAVQDPYIPPSVDPDHSIFAEQDPYIPPRAYQHEPSRAKIYWPAKEYPDQRAVHHEEENWAEQDPDIPRADAEDSVWAEQDPDIPRVDPDHSAFADQGPYIPPRGQSNSFGCPDSYACSRSCRLREFKSGTCVGPRWSECQCFKY